MNFTLSDFNYHLPPALIAQEPTKKRDQARLLVVDKQSGRLAHHRFYELVDFLRPGDVLVLNNSKVFPARLIGQKELSGGQMEVFLHHKISGHQWECLVKGRAKIGLRIIFKDSLVAVLEKDNGDGTWLVNFNLGGKKFFDVVSRIGQIPLPPYIKREKKRASDRLNYQTVYANSHQLGSVAAPTAGLHFTSALLKKIKALGVEVLTVTLHVGLGTFAAVKTENIKDHKMHAEAVEIKKRVATKLLQAKQAGRRIIAVGTTSCRTLESWAQQGMTSDTDFRAWTDIFIYPGYKFKVVDGLVTNFHLPQSTLMMLVSALAGKQTIECAYQSAIEEHYRFFSYGDAMLIIEA